MELRNFFEIFSVYKYTFIVTIIVVFICGIFIYVLQPHTYKSTLLLTVTRDAPPNNETQQYTYDHFYRLQADERFGDTVVQWIVSPFIREQLPDARRLTAKRLSSQVITVTYVTDHKDDGFDIGRSLVTLLNAQSQKINMIQKEEQWFMVHGDKPIVADNVWSAGFISTACSILGIFLGFWVVMIRHYMINDTRN